MITVDDKYLTHTATLCKEVKETSFDITGFFDDETNNIHILEVGCGTGQDALKMAKKLPNSNVLAIDYDVNMINYLSDNIEICHQKNLSFLHKSVYDIQDIASYDLIRAERVFQHLTDISTAFQKLTIALKKNGGLLIVDTNWKTLQTIAFSDEQNQKIQHLFTQQLINELTPEILENLYLKNGFIDVKKEIITVTLTYDDYIRATRFNEIILDKFSDKEKNELLMNVEKYKNVKNFALIDMMVFFAKK